ncbi:MAG: serine hydrolase [Planctomycetota bacterium]|nr:serine hydrolase [Planctomycetota bacterium]
MRQLGPTPRLLFAALGVAALSSVPGCYTLPATLGPRDDYASVAEELRGLIRREIADKGIPALSIALVDGDDIVWAEGFGYADPDRKTPATAATVYRVGSVSKLFTDLAVMQLVERGEIDLDAPVSRYLADFRADNPYGTPVTLRQLMCHRSGLVREPPVGNYFDASGPTLEATVRSLDGTKLVYPPESRQKYSNAGVAVCGYVLEKLRGRPFEDVVRESLLEPMGLESSDFAPVRSLRRRLARAVMWTYDGRVFDAPTFELGTSPAGNLYSTVTDLGRFLAVLFRRGETDAGRVLERETLESMWKVQFAADGATRGFGLGFFVSELDGHRRVGHNGAVYGFSTTLAALPDANLGVVALASRDVTNATVGRIADHALRWMVARRDGRPAAAAEFTTPVDGPLARRLAGSYSSGDERIEIRRRGERLFLERRGLTVEIRRQGEQLVTDDRLGRGARLRDAGGGGSGDRDDRDTVEIDGTAYRRLADDRPAPAPWNWKGLIGEYGPDHNVLTILERHGKLHALIEWFFLYPLEEVSADEFLFPDWGLYHGERIVFTRAADGLGTEAVAAGVRFRRRDVGTLGGETFRIRPRKPEAALRAAARAARPPAETPAAGEESFLAPDLVEVVSLDGTIRRDIRYATTNNFMSMVFYRQSLAFLERPAAEALVRVHRSLKQRGYGLLIYDAYRPWYVTKMFWDATPEEMRDFVADPEKGSRHNRGCAVDLGLYDLSTGEPAAMVAGYDEFTVRSHPDYPGGTSLERWHRRLLREAMEREGFTVYEYEWWHFDYQDWQKYPILNRSFEELRAGETRGESR